MRSHGPAQYYKFTSDPRLRSFDFLLAHHFLYIIILLLSLLLFTRQAHFHQRQTATLAVNSVSVKCIYVSLKMTCAAKIVTIYIRDNRRIQRHLPTTYTRTTTPAFGVCMAQLFITDEPLRVGFDFWRVYYYYYIQLTRQVHFHRRHRNAGSKLRVRT